MKQGDLVRVNLGESKKNSLQGLGEIVKVEADFHGGSMAYTAVWGQRAEHVIDKSPVRARILVLLYDDGGLGWWDEKDVELLEEENKDGM